MTLHPINYSEVRVSYSDYERTHTYTHVPSRIYSNFKHMRKSPDKIKMKCGIHEWHIKLVYAHAPLLFIMKRNYCRSIEIIVRSIQNHTPERKLIGKKSQNIIEKNVRDNN